MSEFSQKLCRAASEGDAEKVKDLLTAGADPNGRYLVPGKRFNCTPMIMAASKGHVGCVKILIEGGADATLVDDSGRTALFAATEACPTSDFPIMAEILVHAGCPLERAAYPGRMSPLATASMHGNLKKVKELLRFGARTEAGEGGRAPISLAQHFGKWDVFKVLLEAGADVNVKAENGKRTVFHSMINQREKPDLAMKALGSGGKFGIEELETALSRGFLSLAMEGTKGWSESKFKKHSAALLSAVLESKSMRSSDKEAAQGAGMVRWLISRGVDIEVKVRRPSEMPMAILAYMFDKESFEAIADAGASRETMRDWLANREAHSGWEEMKLEGLKEWLIIDEAQSLNEESKESDKKRTPKRI